VRTFVVLSREGVMTGDTIVSVNVADLVLDATFQARAKLDQGAVRRYADMMRANVEFPPIVIAKLNGAPVVIDGWHRVKAATRTKQTTLSAVIIEKGEHELAWLAAEANLKHGVPLKASERRNVFRAFVRAGRHRTGRRIKASREIAAELYGLISHTSVMNWMREDFPTVWRQMARRDEVPRADGGLPETDPEVRFEEAVRRATSEVVANSRGITNPAKRGSIISDLRRALDLIEQAAPWQPVEPVDEDDF
jgi:hypothetical protein